jgi:hypothetical protein
MTEMKIDKRDLVGEYYICDSLWCPTNFQLVLINYWIIAILLVTHNISMKNIKCNKRQP